MGRYLADRLGRDLADLSFPVLADYESQEKLAVLTFVSATDGNHGRGVAWAARQTGHQAVVYMPKGSSPVRLEKIRAVGARAFLTDLNYDSAVRLAAKNAAAHGWVLVQDTAWDGYTTMAAEALEQLRAQRIEQPTHILIQAGLGSLAGAVQGFFAAVFGFRRPLAAVVEPKQADCHYRSEVAGDGRPRAVDGDMATIMAGLACDEPSPLSWPVLWDYSDLFVSCPDEVAALGMRILVNSLGGDPRVISGESGAVTAGVCAIMAREEGFRELRRAFRLDENSRVLVFSTEGDTNPASYRSII